MPYKHHVLSSTRSPTLLQLRRKQPKSPHNVRILYHISESHQTPLLKAHKTVGIEECNNLQKIKVAFPVASRNVIGKRDEFIRKGGISALAQTKEQRPQSLPVPKKSKRTKHHKQKITRFPSTIENAKRVNLLVDIQPVDLIKCYPSIHYRFIMFPYRTTLEGIDKRTLNRLLNMEDNTGNEYENVLEKEFRSTLSSLVRTSSNIKSDLSTIVSDTTERDSDSVSHYTPLPPSRNAQLSGSKDSISSVDQNSEMFLQQEANQTEDEQKLTKKKCARSAGRNSVEPHLRPLCTRCIAVQRKSAGMMQVPYWAISLNWRQCSKYPSVTISDIWKSLVCHGKIERLMMMSSTQAVVVFSNYEEASKIVHSKITLSGRTVRLRFYHGIYDQLARHLHCGCWIEENNQRDPS